MFKTIDLAKVTGNRMTGEIEVWADFWETRYSWGHKAEVKDSNYRTLAAARIRYYNRTWESYRFQSVIHSALYNYVRAVTGIDPCKTLCKRDQQPMKSAAAENRRGERVAALEFAKTVYSRLRDYVDGRLVLTDTDSTPAAKVA